MDDDTQELIAIQQELSGISDRSPAKKLRSPFATGQFPINHGQFKPIS